MLKYIRRRSSAPKDEAKSKWMKYNVAEGGREERRGSSYVLTTTPEIQTDTRTH
jgi:hypothetical protein